MKFKVFLLVLFLVVIGVVFLTNFFIKKDRKLDENIKLKQENQELRFQLQICQLPALSEPTGQNQFLTARVFSTYPFNVKNNITISVGKNQGVEKSMMVTIGENILVGRIVEVFKETSVVQTIFDPDFKTPARIGKDQIEGLFQGGNEPRVVLIGKEETIDINSVVYSAGQDFFYNFKIGEVIQFKEGGSANPFKEAVLKIPFSVNQLREARVWFFKNN